MPTPKKKNRGYLWFFAVVILLTVLATTFLAWFNLSLQLTPEELAAQLRLWRDNGPADYDLAYTVKKNDGQGGRHFFVKVRGRRVVAVVEDGIPLADDHFVKFGMDRLFEVLQTNVANDRQPGKPRVYTRARFHDDNGAVLEYVRRVMGTRNRLEISVKTFRFGPDLAN